MFVVRFIRSRLGISPRSPSQALVEWGLMAAVLAFVGALGFNALITNERQYLAGLPTNPAVPSAPGSLLHSTSTTLAGCPTQVKMGNPVSCSVTAIDTYNIPADVNPPLGALDLYYNVGATSTLVASCVLPHITNGATNACVLTWTPTSPGFSPSSGSLVAKYETPQSNHMTSASAASALTLFPNLDISTTCSAPFSSATQVEMGHPTICAVTVHDHFSHAPAVTPINWTSGSPAPGMQLFNCFTNYAVVGPTASFSMLQSVCPTPTVGTYSCTTDSSGTCSVIYRQDPTSTADEQAMGGSSVTIRAFADALNVAPPLTLTILRPNNPHPITFSVGPCTALSGTVTFDPLAAWPVTARTNRNVNAMSAIHIHSSLPTPSASVSCTVVVADASATAAFDNAPPICTNSGPPVPDPCNLDFEDSYPPYGQTQIVDSSNNPLATCATPAGVTWTGIHGYMPALVSGEPEYSSSCQMTLNLAGPTGTHTDLHVDYDAESLPFSSQPHDAGLSPSFTVYFEP